jgi:ankyrin repeat protein
MVRCLVEELGADISQATLGGFTILHIAVQNGSFDVARYLIKDLGADVNKTWHDGSTLLHLAIQGGNKERVVCLVEELGADVNLVNERGVTPLIAASARKHEKIARYLLKNGANAQASLLLEYAWHVYGGGRL